MSPTTDAWISEDGVYRYTLTRRWADGPTALFIMLNPSTADASNDDPTIRRCVGFAKGWGCGALHVVNLFAYRATSPKDLAKNGWSEGPQNRMAIATALSNCDGPLIAAWGATAAGSNIIDYVLGLTFDLGRTLLCLGTTQAGHPRHPLYVKADKGHEVWP